MDSGCEVVIVDVNVAMTNGINGTNGAHEADVADMKTRSSKAAPGASGGGDVVVVDDEAAKPKVRLTRTTVAPKSADDKDSSDGEKKEKKKSAARSGDAEEVGAKSREPATDAGVKAPTGGPTGAVGAAAAVPAPKKKAPERDDDSGINSRASSVSNDDVVGTPARMRTRSSRGASEATPSTSAAGRGGASARLPISIYEFDAASFDDDLPLGASTSKAGTSSAHKRKAVYVEEMDDDEETEEGGAVEPVAKRRHAFLVAAGAGVVSSLLYPLRKLRSGIAAVRTFRVPTSANLEVGEEEVDADGAVGDDVAEVNSPADSETVAQPASSCSLM